MSTYQQDSDISRINSGEKGIEVDENFRQVFNMHQRYTRKAMVILIQP